MKKNLGNHPKFSDMGVPLFFRWLRKKYPEIVDKVLLDANTDTANYDGLFDNLYLDMNGILHPASHGDGVKVCITLVVTQPSTGH